MLALHHLKKLIFLGCLVSLTKQSFSILNNSNSIHYKWDASLDTTNGIASSIETSSKKLHNDKIVPQPSSSISSTLQRIQDGFRKYPDFLGRKSVSFGLLSSNKNTKCFKNDEFGILRRKNMEANLDNGCRSIQISIPFINFSILKFGKPIITRMYQSKSGGDIIDYTIQTKIPIIGGLLSCYHDQCQNNNLGHLHFECRLSVSFLYHNGGNSSNNKLTSMSEEIQPILNIARIQTEIVNYKPKIAGCTVPLNPLREKIYMGLQRPIHAYVMWRFHLHCHSLLE